MKKIMILLMVLFIVSGCTQKEVPAHDNSQTTQKEETLTKSETFTNEYYVNFPKVKNIVSYLKLDAKEIKILKQINNQLFFCFHIDDKEEPTYTKYIELLEDEGYELTILDATISQTFLFKKDNCTLSLTVISNIDDWKEVHKNEYDVEKISTENMVCEINLES